MKSACTLLKLTPWSKVIPEKLTGPELDKNLPAFYGTWRLTIPPVPVLSQMNPVHTPIPRLKDPF